MDIFPDDILFLVGEHLEDHADRYNSIFVSRRFHNIFSRTLYRSATLKNCSEVQCFLKALLRRPELARVVRSLDFEGWQFEPEHMPFLSRADIALFSNWAMSISVSEEEYFQWRRNLLLDVGEAWIALLLPSVNNIRELKLVYPKNSRHLDRMFLRAVSGQRPFDEHPAFHRLEKVSLTPMEIEGEESNLSPKQILPFLQMPSMRALTADAVVEPCPAPTEDDEEDNDDDEEKTPEEPASHSHISEITLTSSNGSQGMKALIASCSSLKSFKYQHSDEHLLAEGFRPSEFYKSLSRSKASLETLWLDNFGEHHAFIYSGLNQTYDDWFGSLADFTSLKDLRIRLPNVLDTGYGFEPVTPLIEVLPRSIESLYVEGCREYNLGLLVRQLQLLLDVRKTRFGSLRRLDIEGCFHDDDEEGDISGVDGSSQRQEIIRPRVYAMVKPLQQACVEGGVSLFLRDRACPQTM